MNKKSINKLKGALEILYYESTTHHQVRLGLNLWFKQNYPELKPSVSITLGNEMIKNRRIKEPYALFNLSVNNESI